jgi:GDP-mannose pyrophosphatase NudK
MNQRVRNLKTEILSKNWYTLKKATYEYLKKSNVWSVQHREVYDRGNGATILLYNKETKNVILTRQFRIPTFLNGHPDGLLIEACAGVLDHDHPEECIRRETEEETGFTLREVKKIMEAYMSPGSVTEMLHFFIAQYTRDMKTSEGGGVGENEEIEVLELPFERALHMVNTGEIKDAKTILLLQYMRLHQLL